MKKLVSQIEEIIKAYSDSELQETFKFLKEDKSKEIIFLAVKNEMGTRVIAQLKEDFKKNIQSLSYEKLIEVSELHINEPTKDPYFLNVINEEIQTRQAKEIDELLGSFDSLLVTKKEKTQKEEKFEAKVGDIFYSSWGYDQTNVDFYQVVKRTKKSVYLRQVRSQIVNDNQKVALKDQFYGDEVIRKVLRVYNDRYSVSLNSFSSAYQWDGKPKTFTTYA